jgi:hypothetical protein
MRYIDTLILIGFMVCVASGIALARLIPEVTPTEAIATFVKDAVKDTSGEEMRKLMIEHYTRLYLLDADMNWTLPELNEVSFVLLPEYIEQAEVERFIDTMALNAGKNVYLKEFLERASKEDFSEFIQNAKTHGKAELPSVIAYGMVLDRLTRVMARDLDVLRGCMGVFSEAAKISNMKAYAEENNIQKLRLVENLVSTFVFIKRTGTVYPGYGKWELKQNIEWAVDIDTHLGYIDNAETGSVLMKYYPGYGNTQKARLSLDGKVVLLDTPRTREWVDLYATWNMAFVSHYTNLPLMIIKLLIPSVSGYQGNPEGYLYVRSIALYTHMYYMLLSIADAEQTHAFSMSEVVWNDDALTRLWGEVNKESSLDYIEKAEEELTQGDAFREEIRE